MFGRRFESAHLHKRGSQLAESLFCGDAHRCKAAVYYICLGALPLLYPAAPPSVFAFGKYTAPAVALVREYVVVFWGIVWGFFLKETTGSVVGNSSCLGLMPRGSAPIILEDLTGKSSSIGFAATIYA